MRFLGSLRPEFVNAPRKRSFDSSTVLLANPTMTMFGRLFEIWHSMSTGMPLVPRLMILLTAPMDFLILTKIFTECKYVICRPWNFLEVQAGAGYVRPAP
jgi:hypothetical protein